MWIASNYQRAKRPLRCSDMTRCRPGDTVVVVRNTTGLRCVDLDQGHIFTPDAFGLSGLGPAWRRSLRCPHCGHERWYLDADLLPIRGEPIRATDDVREGLPAEVNYG